MEYKDDPLFKYSIEKCRKMTREEYCALVEEHNEYVHKKHSQINENITPKFNTIEEIMEYYDAIPLEDFFNNLKNLLDER